MSTWNNEPQTFRQETEAGSRLIEDNKTTAAV